MDHLWVRHPMIWAVAQKKAALEAPVNTQTYWRICMEKYEESGGKFEAAEEVTEDEECIPKLTTLNS